MKPVSGSADSRWHYVTLSLIVLAVLTGFWSGLFAGFDGDDLMNLHEAVQKNTLQQIVTGFVFPFTPVNRPTGELYYRLCYWLFGWNPPGFRLVTIALMAANVALVYAVARELTASVEAGLLSALLFAFHGRLWQIYRSNGTVYDVLCAFFGLLALRYYIETRKRGEGFGLRRWVVLAVLFIAALNAKEMAAVFPALFLIYDWVYVAPERRLPKRLRWILINSRPAVTLGVATLLALYGKTRSGGPFVNPLYEVSLTVPAYFHAARWLFSELFYLRPHTLVGRHVVLLFIMLFVIAALSRRKSLWFFAWFAVLAPLPVLFIPPRGFFVMYLPLAGWAMFAAAAMLWVRDRLSGSSVSRGWGRIAPVVVCLVAIVYGLNDPEFRARAWIPDPISRTIDLSKQDFIRMNEPIPSGAAILLTGSRFPATANEWFPYMIVQLLYRDRNLRVYRTEMMNPVPRPDELREYDRVFVFDGAQLTVQMRSPVTSGTTRVPGTAPAWR